MQKKYIKRKYYIDKIKPFIDKNIIGHVIDFIDNTPKFKKILINKIKWY